MSSASSSTNSPSPPGQGEQYRMDEHQRRLIMLIHANKCLASDEHPCTTPYCAEVKNILKHMKECRQGDNCTVSGCAQSHFVLSHYQGCQDTNCGICVHVRKVQIDGNAYHQNPTPIPNPIQSWHKNLDPGVRNQLVGTLTTCLPSPTDIMNPNSINQAAQRARQIETQVFFRAASLVAYLVHIEMLIDVARWGEPATKEWHREVPFIERVRSVTRMMESVIGEETEKQRIYRLIGYAKGVEREVYVRAESPEEYIHALQGKAEQMKGQQ